MVYRRRSENLHFSAPNYGCVSKKFTVCLKFGGRFHYIPTEKYEGGSMAKWDCVELKDLNFENLNSWCNSCELLPLRRFYAPWNGGFKLMNNLEDLKEYAELFAFGKDRELTFFVDLSPSNVASADNPSPSIDDSVQSLEMVEKDQVVTSKNKVGTRNKGKRKVDEVERAEFVSQVRARSKGIVINELVKADRDKVKGKVSFDCSGKGKAQLIVWGEEDDTSDSEYGIVPGSDDDIDSCLESDFEDEDLEYNRPKKNVFKDCDTYDPKFDIDMVFPTKKEFTKAINGHAVKSFRNLKIPKNDSKRMYAKCGEPGCGWRVHAHRITGELGYAVHTYEPKHDCVPVQNVNNAKSRWLCDRFIPKLKIDPNKPTKVFRLEVQQELGIEISKDQAYRAKRMALEKLEGDPAKQYEKLWDYSEELRATNPGSTVICDIDRDTGKFSHFYVCFGACKQGFISGCRPIIGIDGAHLKGPHKGILFTAIGIDPNNKGFPIAYAVMGTESGETWSWFLRILRQDLEITRNENFTFMSDKQKGLIKGIQDIFCGATHRFCAVHLWKNMWKAGFRGDAYRKDLFRCSNATTLGQWKSATKALEDLDENAYKWVMERDPNGWCKSHFNTIPKCDITSNNFCESYNSVVVNAREKPILTMLEWIREYDMTKMQKARDKAEEKWNGKLCPGPMRIYLKNLEGVRDCITRKCDNTHYQITHFDGAQYNVDLEHCSCTCRKWELTGMPCKHAMSAMLKQKRDPMDFVNSCYYVDTYKKVYAGAIYGVNGQELWGETLFVPPLPPDFTKKKGRPERNRRRGEEEGPQKKKKKSAGPIKGKRYQTTLKCSYCGKEKHNKKTCPLRKHENEAKTCGEGNEEQEEELSREFRESFGDVLEDDYEFHVDDYDLGMSVETAQEEQTQSTPPAITKQDKLPVRKSRRNLERGNCSQVGNSHEIGNSSQLEEPTVIRPPVVIPPLPTPPAMLSGPTAHSQLLRGKASFASNYTQPFIPPRANIRAPPTISGLLFPPLSYSQPSITPSYPVVTHGGKKYIQLNDIAKATAETKEQKGAKKNASRPPWK